MQSQADTNPCTHIEKYAEKGRERSLRPKSWREVLSDGEASGKLEASAAAAVRLLLFTGCRRDEVLTLEWEQVDLERELIALPDAKAGARAVLLTAPGVTSTPPTIPCAELHNRWPANWPQP